MSNRVRTLSLALITSLVVLTAATAAAGATRTLRRESAWSAYPQATPLAAYRRFHSQSQARRVFPAAAAPRTTRTTTATALATAAGTGPASPLSAGLPYIGGPSGFGSALVGAAPVGKGPSTLAVDAGTHTIYVANGNNDDGPNAGGDTVSVIDARHCQAQDVSRCPGPWPTIVVGSLPSGIAIDKRTDTVYVSNFGDNTVSVFNGASCNAQVTSGCGQVPATVPVGLKPIGLYADPANHTVYVPNFDNGAGDSTTVSMIDSESCNAARLSACPTTEPPTVNVGAAPDDVAVNQATHTVYVTTIGAQNGWSVFDANTCDATTQSGCKAMGTLTGDAAGPNAAEVDPANNTLYTANYDNTISAFDLSHCNASDLAGCASQTPGIVTPFPAPFYERDLWVAVDAPLHSVYVVYHKDDMLIVVDTNVCNGSHLAACATLTPPTIHTGTNPESVRLDPHTQTLYTANEIDNNVSVIDATRCNAATTSGCRHPAPAFTSAPGALAADPSAHTLYDATGTNSVSMINTRTCNAHQLAGCRQAPPQVTVGTNPSAIAVDRRTHTVYVANFGSHTTPGPGTVSVIDGHACNATHSAGCAHAQTLQVPGGNPDDIAVNAATDTIYVATTTDSGPNLVSAFNGATCNATTAAGCDQTPATLQLGDSGGAFQSSSVDIAVNKATNTIYATNTVVPNNNLPYIGDSVSVINGATCDAANTSGCGQTPATITAGNNPGGIAVDPTTNTVYTANLADGELAGTVSVINGATCNSANFTGCGQTPQTVPVGFGAAGVAIDRSTHRVYVTNDEDASVSVINENTCNGTNTTGCDQTPPKVAVGNYPIPIAIDPQAGTAYVTNGDNTVSVIPLTP